jgi:hypothetical protein
MIDFSLPDVTVYNRQCKQCGFVWQYQEWGDGLHNYDNCSFLSFDLCRLFRSSIQVKEFLFVCY